MSKSKGKGKSSKEKTKNIVICVILCVCAVVISGLVFLFELRLSYYAALNKTLSTKWIQTELVVTKVVKDDSEVPPEAKMNYLGKVWYVDRGKYMAYNKDCWYGDKVAALACFHEVKLGDKLPAYFKPDDFEKVAVLVPYRNYIIALAALFVLLIVIVVLSRIFRRFMLDHEETGHKDGGSPALMNIPLFVCVIGFLGCFIAGMVVGTNSLGSEYTEINEGQAAIYEGEYNKNSYEAYIEDKAQREEYEQGNTEQ